MARIDMMFYDTGAGNVAFSSSLEEDREEEAKAGGDGNIVVHMTFEESDEDFRGAVVQAIYATHVIENAGLAGDSGCTVFERFVSEIFKAGMEYGRELATKEVQ